MKKSEIYQLLNQNPMFQLATIEGDQPRVRTMMLYQADENGIVFHTGAMKPVYQQIKSNPKVELCFWDMQNNIQVRISGILEITQDNQLKDEIYSHPSRAFLSGWKESMTADEFYESFIVFKLKKGQAVTWTMESNFVPQAGILLD